MAKQDSNSPAYEELLERLAASVARLESGGLTLNEALATYEEGTAIAMQCQALLETAEQKIRELRQVVEPES